MIRPTRCRRRYATPADQGDGLVQPPHERTALAESLLVSGFPYDAWNTENDNTTEWRRFLKQARSLRCDGAAALDLCYVACGRVDGYWERGLEPWDVAAGALIVSEAGGRVTDYQGDKYFISRSEIVAANSRLHADMLFMLH